MKHVRVLLSCAFCLITSLMLLLVQPSSLKEVNLLDAFETRLGDQSKLHTFHRETIGTVFLKAARNGGSAVTAVTVHVIIIRIVIV